MVTGPFAHGAEGWRVRVRGQGGVLGAGVLVDPDHVVTCAHVVLDAGDLAVDLVALPGAPSSAAAVLACVPPRGDRGDVAVLRLAASQPPSAVATLRKVALAWDRDVHTLGYPRGEGLDIGVWARMRLAAHAGSEWLQMNRRAEGEQRVRAGFSGSGVADDATGDVLGIVVSEYTDEGAGLAWMLPVAAIEAHLPLVSEWVVGDDGIDPPATAPTGSTAAVRPILDWLARRADGGGVLVVAGDALDALRHAVVTAGAGPDLTIDVEGLTAEQVSRRIVDRAGLDVHGSSTERIQAGTPPMTIIADGVDQAGEPQALLDSVLRPLVASGARLVVGVRGADPSGAHTLARDTVTARLDGFAGRIAALGADTTASRLRISLSALRRAAAADYALVADRLPRLDRAITRAEQAREARLQQQDETADLRGLLAAWQAKATDGGLVEHIGIATALARVHALLAADPVDLPAAHAAARAYQDAVRQALAEGGRG
ncbi:S1 family peptidase [Actinokineospora sp. NPDC004072]